MALVPGGNLHGLNVEFPVAIEIADGHAFGTEFSIEPVLLEFDLGPFGGNSRGQQRRIETHRRGDA